MNKRTFLLAGGLGASGLSLGARAQPARLRYGGDAAFAPFESMGADGRPQGFLIDLLIELERVTGRGIEVTLGPWARTEAAFRSGDLDLIAMVDTDARRAFAQFTRGVASPTFGLYRRADAPEPQGLRELEGLRVAVLDSEPSRDTLATALGERAGPIIRTRDAAAALDAIVAGQADVALLPRPHADAALAARPDGGLVASHVAHTMQPFAFAVAPERDDLLAELQHGLDTLEQEGRLEALRRKWLDPRQDLTDRPSPDAAPAPERTWNWNLVGAGLSLAVFAGATILQRVRNARIEKRRRARAKDAPPDGP